MKRKSKFSGRFALTSVAAAALCLASPLASALGLGRLSVQSALGEALQAEIDVTSMTPEEQANLRIRVAPPEAYRTANVDYNPVLPSTRATLQKRSDGRLVVRLQSDRGVQEPFVDVILEISWATGRLVREYTLLFDPPATTRTAAAAAASSPAATSPVMSSAMPVPTPIPSGAAPAPAAPTMTARERRAAARAAAVESARSEEPRSSTRAAASASSGANGDEYRVQAGDSLSKIAGRTQRQGVSLDQMLVALFRANPDAFVGSNMNRLKAGVVLAVPSAETAQATSTGEARQTIVAQSADFGAYRQKLASSTLTPRPEGSERRAGGKVQAAVEDRQQAAPTPDKLTLSKGGTPAAAVGGNEERLSRERERQAAATKASELARNVEDLKRLQGAASGPRATTAPAVSATATAPRPGTPVPSAAPSPSPSPSPAPTIVAAAPSVAPSLAPAPAARASTVVSTPTAPTPPVVAPTAVTASAAPAVSPASAVVPPLVVATAVPASSAPPVMAQPASAVVLPRPIPRPATRPVPVAEPSLVDTLFANPLYLGLGALAVLLGGFGIYRYLQRSRKDSGETSFLESRLQPDSFFGASGGQRIDTRDAGGTSSSMTYSLSQLDAIGDVDPVAEADVYLAYGRDLQAEEILKEAIRSNPERLAIRTKLLEVYAKRRDTKGFELLATQLFALTRGEGEDWAKAQELGAQIDPDNPLFRPGGAPERPLEPGERPEPLGASTLPQSVVPVPSQFGSSVADSGMRDSGLGDAAMHDSQFTEVDFDLDDPDVGTPSQPMPLEDATHAMPPRNADDASYQMTTHKMPLVDSEASTPDHRDEPLAFDLSGISLDLDKPAANGSASDEPMLDAIELPFDADDGSADPLARKLELAEEFQRIGDKDGARDLLREVLATASGATKTKAQGMLDGLG